MDAGNRLGSDHHTLNGLGRTGDSVEDALVEELGIGEEEWRIPTEENKTRNPAGIAVATHVVKARKVFDAAQDGRVGAPSVPKKFDDGENDQMMQGLVYGKQEFAALSFGACAALGFALAVIGLFSVMTYIVSLRTHDIGVRLALGAPRSNILRLMLNRGARLIVTGIVIGLVTSLALTRYLAGQFRGVSATDPLTLSVVVVAVLVAGISACVLPARRAASVDPMVTLRYE